MHEQATRFGLPPDVVRRIREVLTDFPGVEEAILYGSRATGNFRTSSDIDLCVVGQGLTSQDLLRIINRMDDLLLPWKMDLCLQHTLDNPALSEVIRLQGVMFYRR